MAVQTMNQQKCINCGADNSLCHIVHDPTTGEYICMRCRFLRNQYEKTPEHSPLAHELSVLAMALETLRDARFSENEKEIFSLIIFRLESAAQTASAMEHAMPLAPVVPINPALAEKDLVVYLACPYSHPTAELREHRFFQANHAAKWLFNKGYGVISPISQGHAIGQLGGVSGDWAAWEKTDLRMIKAADALIVLNIPGMRESTGVTAEVAFARFHDLPVSYLTPIGNEYVVSETAPKIKTGEAAHG